MFGCGFEVPVSPRYNIAPTQNVLAVRLNPGSKTPEAVNLRWGLVPGGGEGEPGRVAEPAGGRGGGRRLRADRRGQPCGGRREPRERHLTNEEAQR